MKTTLDSSISRRFRWCAIALAVFVMAWPLAAQADSAEDAGWELVLTDTFDREELGKNWEVVEGSWKVEDGALVGSGTLISTRGFPGPDPHRTLPGTPPPGFIRLEFEARTEVRHPTSEPGAPAPAVSASAVSAFIHVPPSDSKIPPTKHGYFFQLGGLTNAPHVIRRAGTVVVEQQNPQIKITPDKLHRIVVENDEGILRMVVDGRTVFEQKETANIMGDDFDRVGFYFHTRTRVERVRVFVKRLTDGYF